MPVVNNDVKRLSKAIATLLEQDVHPDNYLLLAVLVEGILWSEETHQQIIELAKKIATELYDAQAINCEPEELTDDVNNPRNWKELCQ